MKVNFYLNDYYQSKLITRLWRTTRKLSLIFVATFILHSIGSAQYCNPSPSSVDGTGINNVTIGTNVNNTTVAETGNYGDYSAMSAIALVGTDVPFSFTLGTDYTYTFKVWVDWNNDYDFDDAGEEIFTGSTALGYSGNISIASDAMPGTHRLRIGANDPNPLWGGGPTVPCYAGAYGAYEDYSLFVITEPLTCNLPFGLVANATSSSSGTISWTAPDPAPLGYDVYYNTTGVAPDASTEPSFDGVTSTSQAVSDLAPFNTYYFFVRSSCDGEESAWVGPVSFYLGYCIPTTTWTGDHISSFSTSGATVNVSTSAGSWSSAYTDYTSMTISHYGGASFNFSTTYVGGTNGVNVWVDWNNNLEFEASELVFTQLNNPAVTNGTINIPGGTALGDYRLRIRSQWGTGANPPACGNVPYGETEDYTLTVIDPPTCAPPTALSGTGVANGESVLTWQPSLTEGAIGYEWVLVAQGGLVTDTPIASGTTAAGVTTATATGLTDFTIYTLYVRTDCDDDDLSLWAGPFNLPGPCTTAINGQYPGGAAYQPTCNGTSNIITECAYASEYSIVQVEEGEEYIFGISVATDIITITNEDASVVYAVGTGGSLTWTSTVTGIIRFFTHTVGCGGQSVCRIKTVQCGEPWVNEANVQILYTLGGVPVVFGDDHVIQALISNPAADTWTKEVTLTITGANTFTSTYELTLSGNSSELISFEPFTATNLGQQTVTVSVEDDNVNSNNTYSVEQLVTPNLFSHKEPDAPMAAGGVGIGGGYTGNFVAKFTTAEPAEVNEIKVDFTGTGGINYQYRIFSADGPGGLPNTILYDSPVMVSAPGQAFLPVSPAVPVNGDFYVGLRELGTNFQFNYQVESPLRSGIFYFNTEDGTFPWTDISTSGAPTARLAIEAQLYTETAPNCALNMLPLNGDFACHMAGTTLSWTSGGGGATGYHVYFGTDENPELVGDVTTSSYEVESLEEGTTYYWYVVPFNEFGDAEGCDEVYSFVASMDGCFCTPTYVNGTNFDDLIANVEILGTTLANNTGTEPGTPAYTYFTGEPNYTADLQAGASYTISVSVGNTGNQNVAVWIDYNDNGSFEVEEKVGYTGPSIGANGSATFSINLNCLAPIGTHRMRVRGVWNIPGSQIDPCAEYGYGETEDYDITITEADACPAPFGGFAEYITNVSAVLFWEQGCLEEEWNVHLTTAGGGAPTGDPSHPNATSPLTVDGLEPFSFYEFWVMAICDDENSSTWSGPYTFATLAEAPIENDNPCGAIALPITEECTYQEFSNELAGNTPFIPTPTCSLYNGADVWFSVVVPGNGIVTIDTQSGLITDAGMAVYTADECLGTFTQVGCSDDDSPTGGTWMPYVALTGQTPGQTLYIRIFSYGNFEAGTFGICVTSPCTAPADAEIVADVELNTVTITWPSMGPDATYNWEIRESGDAGSGDVGLIDSDITEAGVTSITITGLEYLSIYNFYISTNCSEDATSDWSGAVEVVIGALPGCMDPEACNYNPDAGQDDGSCIAEESTWYLDADGDGYGDSQVSQVACEGPEGYVSNSTDCDDDDDTVWQSASLFVDADGDGYDNGSEVVCYGATIPDGYSETTEGLDCNDNNPNSWGQEVLDVTLSLPVPTVCDNSSSFTLTGGSPAGGTWSSTSPGITGSTFNPATAGAGTHTITYTVAGDGICTIGGSASAVLTVTVCPGVDEASANEISLYPSHTNGNVTIVGTNLKEAVVMDLNGKHINTVSLNNTSVISMHDYSAGIYFVRVIGDNKVKTFKVVRVN